MDIEGVAEEDPDAIKTVSFPLNESLSSDIAEKIVDDLDLTGKTRGQGIEQLQKLYKMFVGVDATQVEVNPWAITPDLDIYCVDAKINVDENAHYRQSAIVEEHESSDASGDTDANETKATAAGLNYIALDGNIGCMVNGAGLAMGTMDIIQLKGGKPANFLDVGGGATTDQVKTAFEILSSHTSVKTILVNIFGGIMKCDTIAMGIIEAAKQVDLKVPVVVRLTGTNADIACELLGKFAEENKARLSIEVIPDFDKAADQAVLRAQ